MGQPLITQFNTFIKDKYYSNGYSKGDMPKPYKITTRHLNKATDKKTYNFNVPPCTDLTYNLAPEVVNGIRDSLKGNVIRDRLLTLTNQPLFETKLLSYLFGAYIASLDPTTTGFKFSPITLTGPKGDMIKSLLTTRHSLSVPLVLFNNLSPKLVLLGYIENCVDYRVSGTSVVITNSQRISQLIVDNGWAMTDAGKLLVIPDAFSLLKSVSDFSFEMFIDINKSLKDIMILIAGSQTEKINIKDLDSFMKYYPGFVFHSMMGDTYSFSEYHSWDLRSFVKGRQNEGTAFRKVNDFMRALVKHLGLYEESEYESAHVLVGVDHYDIPTLSGDLAYILYKTHNIGTAPVDQPRFRVWDHKILELKESLTEFFTEQLENIRRDV